jgi:hypothetical protein
MLKVVKGAPESKKDNGFLSVERLSRSDLTSYYVVYRNFMGSTLFTAVISPSLSKVKLLDDKPGKPRAKIALCQRQQGINKIVHVELKFISDSDCKTFIDVFTEYLDQPNDRVPPIVLAS